MDSSCSHDTPLMNLILWAIKTKQSYLIKAARSDITGISGRKKVYRGNDGGRIARIMVIRFE
jgi:hypothetical protein